MKKVVRTDKAPNPVGPYSQGLICGKRVYVSGQGPFNAETGTKPEGVAEQTRQTLKNVQAILEAAGASMDHVVKVTAHLQEVTKDFRAFNEVYREFFNEPFPVRTTVGSDLLDILVEIDVIAELD
ncbi:2-iminobutanoate/2-iminopropanoate deaminase [Aminivibrio pyruvatiphilus]|uniref:2-iminobutanoate/2-iminopropanoate deaminase n=1 Tax=Aminivibrio pyruvatiphilus TaxID=1005740 RepID=A0A4R8MAQ6_9BACT|nr:Rid family detoxifying hydrolase [Aminivibrio pyruvatiphilus]TDY61207.1 2-iminobutanoate/2-iminopropanoate deaminase [Aminivibrio pyruvatiphilus]